MKIASSELPYETYERVTGKRWVSGKSSAVKSLLQAYGIKAPAGSEQANAELQRALKAKPDVALGAPKPVLPALPSTRTPDAIPDLRSPIDRGYAQMRTSRGGSVADTFPAVIDGPSDLERITAPPPGGGWHVWGRGNQGPLVAPTMQEVEQSPRYQTRLNAGNLALDRERDAQEYGEQAYGQEYNRRLGEYQQGYDEFADSASRGMTARALNEGAYQSDVGNQAGAFDRNYRSYLDALNFKRQR